MCRLAVITDALFDSKRAAQRGVPFLYRPRDTALPGEIAMQTLFQSTYRDGRIDASDTEFRGVALVTVVGDCDVWEAKLLREAIDHVEDSDARTCIVSLSNATYLCARVFSVLSAAARRFEARDRSFEIVCRDGHIACRIFALLRLPFRNWASVGEAVAKLPNRSREPSIGDGSDDGHNV